jgi:hypothetical protein
MKLKFKTFDGRDIQDCINLINQDINADSIITLIPLSYIDKETGKEFFVYSCYNQDQDLDSVDFVHLNSRLKQNSVQEKLSSQWLEFITHH